MKTWKVALTEDELKALIDYHSSRHPAGGYSLETSARIHDLTKRLNKETPEIENDPRPKEDRIPQILAATNWEDAPQPSTGDSWR